MKEENKKYYIGSLAESGSSLVLITLFVLFIIAGGLLVYEMAGKSAALTTPQMEEDIFREINKTNSEDEMMEENSMMENDSVMAMKEK